MENQPSFMPSLFSGFARPSFVGVPHTHLLDVSGSVTDDKQPEPLVPGSAVSAILVRGDLNIAATCTVTYMDPSRLLACGHPLLQNVRRMITTGEVHPTDTSGSNCNIQLG